VGLISDSAWAEFEAKQQRLDGIKKILETSKLPAGVIEGVDAGMPLAQLLKRPEITIEQLVPVLRPLAAEFFERSPEGLTSEVRNELKSVETEIKYEGYLRQQDRAIERLKKSEQRAIPQWFDYRSVSGLHARCRRS